MAYTKLAWLENGTTPINATNLNHLETQYDEAIAQAAVVRADSTKELRAEVVATLTGETPTAGRLVHNTGNGFFYGGNGSAWGLIGGGATIKSRQFVAVNWTSNASIADLKTDRVVAITPVTDYTKCMVIIHGYAPFLTTGTYVSTTLSNQLIQCPFYGKLTANNSMTVVISYPDVTSATNWTSVTQALITNWSGATLMAEIIEFDGLKSVTLVEKSFSNTRLVGLTEALPGTVEPTKCHLFVQGSLLYFTDAQGLANRLEMLGLYGVVTGSNAVIAYANFPYIGTGSSGYTPVYQTVKMAYYILETF